jgi:hypothetical protein
MAYVCESLEIINGLQTCTMWIIQNETSSLLSGLTAEQAQQLGILIMYACVTAFCYKLLGYFIKTFIK